MSILLAGAAIALAEPAAQPSAWTTRVWNANDGLPDNRVTGVVQTRDGALWVATRGGLVRFNGSTFESFDLTAVKGVIGNVVQAMACDSRGNFWLGAAREQVLRVGPDSVQVYSTTNVIPAGQFSDFAEDETGTVWLAFGGRVCQVNGAALQELELPVGTGTGGRASLTCDIHGVVWGSVNGWVGEIHAGRFEQRFQLDSRDVELATARTGGLWACAGSRVYRMAEGNQPVACADLPPGVRALSMLEDSAGALWIGTVAHGLFRYNGQGVEKVETSHLNVGTLTEDREGNIWAGTLGGGLNRIRPRVMELIGTQSGLPFESVDSVCQDMDGTYWAVSTSGLLARSDKTAWSVVPEGGGAAACVAADRQGRLWVGTRGVGLRELNLRNGQLRTWLQGDGLPSNSIRAVLVAADDSLWFATNGPPRIGNLSHGKIRTWPTPPTTRTIRALVQDTKGVIWIGTSDGQVLQVSGDALISNPAFPNSDSISVRCLHPTPDGSLWIGYDFQGVGIFKDGRYLQLSTASGLADNSIWQIASDRTGSLWFAGPHGLVRTPMDEAIAVAAGRREKLRPTLYGQEENLPKLQPHFDHSPAVCQSSDGRILLATSLGLLALNPENIHSNPVPPPLVLERVTIDDQLVAMRAARFPLRGMVAPEILELGSAGMTLHLRPDHRKLTIDFAALSYSAPENVRLRYRLDGFDNAWTTPRSERSANYSRLPAGNYTFRVIASNDAGVWNEEGATLGISVSPFYWQTWWFRLGLIGAFTALVVAVVRFVSFQRLRAKLQLAEQQAALFQERTRIARDIHDDLGGSLAHVKLLSEIAVRDRTGTEAADEHLQQITSATRQMLKSLDETIWAINPRNDTLPSLISYLGQHTVEFLRAAGIKCQVDLPDNPPEITVTSDVRHHVFLVVKEALTNIVRHSGARTVILRAKIEGAVLHMTIEDDGCGFDRAPDDALADGLRNMQQRMSSLGGNLRIASKAGAGTRIEFEVSVKS